MITLLFHLFLEYFALLFLFFFFLQRGLCEYDGLLLENNTCFTWSQFQEAINFQIFFFAIDLD